MNARCTRSVRGDLPEIVMQQIEHFFQRPRTRKMGPRAVLMEASELAKKAKG